MGEKKVTIMRLKVDLQCCKCRKKVKKILCKIPQIQDQVYNEKENTVTIKVVCCSPEKIMEKIRCKGGESIKSMEIVPPPKPKPKEPEKPKGPTEPVPNTTSDSDKTNGSDKTNDSDMPKAKAAFPPQAPAPQAQPKGPEKPPPPPQAQPNPPKPAPQPTPPVVVPCIPATGYPPPYPCCRECHEGRGGGPCYGGPRVIYYDGYCGRPVDDSGGGGYGRSYYRSRCTDDVSEENPNAACTIL